MNNSDIISALSIAFAAIIFIMQTDDSLLKLKIKRGEKYVLIGITISIILLVNHNIFDRFAMTFYWSVFNVYLKPEEWALFLFLLLVVITLYRLFTPKIFTNDIGTVFRLLDRYRLEKNWVKLTILLQQILNSKRFEEDYAEKLNDSLFNDYHVLEHFASNYPYLLISFSKSYPEASINEGEHFFSILTGLFADKSNPIFAEIRHYHQEPGKRIYLDEFGGINHEMQDIHIQQIQPTSLPIIFWLTSILTSFPYDLKEEAAIFFEQFERNAGRDNKVMLSEKAVHQALSRDPIWNSLQLFRILLLELTLTDYRMPDFVDRPLLLYYSAWDFIEKSTQLQREDVALNNDSYTINEYLLKYLFNSYISLYIAIRSKVDLSYNNSVDDDKDNSAWVIQKLFAKLDSLISSDRISDNSKLYYMEELFTFYFDASDLFGKNNVRSIIKAMESLLWELGASLTKTPYGDVVEIRRIFKLSCKEYEFYRHNDPDNLQPAQVFYSELIPYTTGYEDNICDV